MAIKFIVEQVGYHLDLRWAVLLGSCSNRAVPCRASLAALHRTDCKSPSMIPVKPTRQDEGFLHETKIQRQTDSGQIAVHSNIEHLILYRSSRTLSYYKDGMDR